MNGSVIGNYRMDREIGEGGMSHVFVGRTLCATEVLPLDYPVVLKVMSDELAGEVTARKRFVKEAQILAKLRHRYITRFYEFINDAKHAVLIMEYVEGTPVDVLLAEKGALPLQDAIGIAQNLLEALVYAHGKGIVHRDIKPANLIREKSGNVKVTDFGIAKIKEGGTSPGQTVLTKSGFLLGTPHYMSPEQIREPKDAGARADVYSSGVVLYEMLTGQLPFNSRSLPKLIDAIYRGEKQPPSALRPEVDKELEAIVLKSMSPRMDQRYESAREFYEALEEYEARQPLRPTAKMAARGHGNTGRSAEPGGEEEPVGPGRREERLEREILDRRRGHGGPRPDLLDRADASGRVAPPRENHVQRIVLRAGGPEVRQRNVCEQRSHRARKPETRRRRSIRRRPVLQLCAERPLNES